MHSPTIVSGRYLAPGDENALVVPAQAVQSGQTNEFVFVVQPDQGVEMRSVKPGLSRNGETVVESGLTAGETVVTDGQVLLELNTDFGVSGLQSGELAAVVPLQGPAGFGTYEAGVWAGMAAHLPSGSPALAQAVSAALALHVCFLICAVLAGLGASALSGLMGSRPGVSPN